MKFITGALVIVALLGEQETQAIKINTGFTDDLVKSLTEDLAKDEGSADVKEEKAPAKNETKKDAKAAA